MKWITVIFTMILLFACTRHVNDPSIQYRQVLVTPQYQVASSYDDAPVDVTQTIVSVY